VAGGERHFRPIDAVPVVQRRSVLLAAVALVALATAAGTFDAVEGPSISADGTPDAGDQTPDPSAGTPGGARDDDQGERVPETTPAGGSDGGGLPSLVVPAVLGSLLAGGLFVVVLTGDDRRASLPDESDDDGDENTDSVDPPYDLPGDGPVVRSWRRLASRAGGEDTETPREVARRAVERGLPERPIETVSRQFRSVRYGDSPASDDRERTARAAAERLEPTDPDSGDEQDDDSDPETSGGGPSPATDER